MYTRFFGLAQAPFSIAPDPRYLFMSERHREALAHLLYGLDGGGGFVLLTGEIGAGKTTVCRLFLEQMPEQCNVAYVFNPKQSVIELLQSVCDEFGVSVPRRTDAQASVKDFIDPLNAFLLAAHAALRNNILIIDEAQNLSADVLEQLRLLTNLETNERKLLQIILIGQPELRGMLARPELEQLAQRVIARFHLGALTEEETTHYIAHRLSVAGLTQVSPFSGRVMRRIHARARGVPRRINLLCDRVLLGTYARGRHQVDLATVDVAAREVFDTGVGVGGKFGSRGPIAAGGAAALALVAIALFANREVSWPGKLAPVAIPGQTPAPLSPVTPVRPTMSTSLASVASRPGSLTGNAVNTPNPPVAAAPASGIVPMPASAPVLDPSVRDLQAAVRQLAARWDVTLQDADACHAAARNALYCFIGRNGLTEIRQLDRPVVLTLQDDANEKYYALLLGLGRATALLQIGDRRETVTLAALAKRWRGGFTSLWRGPAGYARPIALGDRGDAVDWAAARLAVALGGVVPPPGIVFDAAASARVREFQLTQGLVPDGLPGPRTMIWLAAVAGDQSPHLQPLLSMSASEPVAASGSAFAAVLATTSSTTPAATSAAAPATTANTLPATQPLRAPTKITSEK